MLREIACAFAFIWSIVLLIVVGLFPIMLIGMTGDQWWAFGLLVTIPFVIGISSYVIQYLNNLK